MPKYPKPQKRLRISRKRKEVKNYEDNFKVGGVSCPFVSKV